MALIGARLARANAVTIPRASAAVRRTAIVGPVVIAVKVVAMKVGAAAARAHRAVPASSGARAATPANSAGAAPCRAA